jgi:hypothetical protein
MPRQDEFLTEIWGATPPSSGVHIRSARIARRDVRAPRKVDSVDNLSFAIITAMSSN